MSSIEKRLRDELGELASWLIDKRAESSSVEQVDSGDDSMPQLDLGADPARSGGRSRLFRVAAVLLLIVGVVSVSRQLSEDAPSVVTVPSDPATQTPATSVPPTTVDDLITDDPGDESSLVELDPEVDPDVPTPGPLEESSIQDGEWLLGPFGGTALGLQPNAPWLFPWGDGFLQIGFVNTSEQIPSDLNFVAQISDDGLNWGEPFLLNLPREHFEELKTDTDPLLLDSWPIVRSNGKGLLVLSQLPGRHFGERGARAAASRSAAPANAHVEQRVFISATDDLESWNHYEYPLVQPDDVDNPLLGNHVVAEDVIVTDEGWMIQVSTLTYIDIGLLLPADIREVTENIRWLQFEDGDYVSSDGLFIEWTIEDASTESIVVHERLFPWEELGITRELFERSWNKYPTGSLLVARSSEAPSRVELPLVDGICCEIIMTDGGFVGLSDAVLLNLPVAYGWGALIFSADGLNWQSIEPPVNEGFKELADAGNLGLWRSSIHTVQDRVVMYGLSPFVNNDCDNRSLSEFFWLGDAKGSTWVSQDISDNPCSEYYRIANSEGTGILVYSDVSDNPDTYGDHYHSTIVSIDGINWFTFYEESDPEPSSVAFNGNVAVRVDNAGNTYRYELQ